MNIKLILLFFSLNLLSSCFIDSNDEGNSVTYYAPNYDANYRVEYSTNAADYRTSEYYSGDADHQNFLEQINAADAYAFLYLNNLEVAGDGVRVAVVDSGILGNHIDLDDNFASDSEIRETDGSGHGTLVSGVIAAEKNDFGMHGVAFNSEIYSILNYGSDDNNENDNQNGGYYEAVLNSSALVINNSWSFNDGFNTDAYIRDIANVIVENDKIVFVFATGNDGRLVPSRPAADADNDRIGGHKLAAAAIRSDGTIASYSNRCGTVLHCLSAPGGERGQGGIYTTSARNGYSYGAVQGTSFAAPVVSGAAAILHGAWDNLTGSQVVDILLETADKTGRYTPDTNLSDGDATNDTNSTYGAGLLDLEEAVRNQGVSTTSLSLSSQSYSYDNTQLNIPQNLQILQNNKNFQSLLAKGVFFDKYNRDYKADYLDKISYYGAESGQLESKVLAKQEVKNVRLAFSKNIRAGFANVKQKKNKLSYFFSPEKIEDNKTFLNEASYNISALGNKLKMNFSFSENSPLRKRDSSELFFSNNNFLSFYEQNSEHSYYNFAYDFAFNDKMSFSNNFIYADNQERNTNIVGVDNKLIQKFKKIAIEYNFSMMQEGNSFAGISGNEAFDFADFTRNDSFGVTIRNTKNRKLEYSFSSNFSTITPEYKSNLFAGSKSYNAFNYNLLMSYQASKNNKLGVAISKPWQIEKGEFSITIPTGIDANNVVETDSVNIDFSSIKSYDFEAFWHKNLTTNSKIKFNSLYKVYDTNKVDFIEDLDDRLELFINYIKEF